MAAGSPRANWSSGASANTSVNSNSAIAFPNMKKSIGAPGRLRETRLRTAGDRPAWRSAISGPSAESVRCANPLRIRQRHRLAQIHRRTGRNPGPSVGSGTPPGHVPVKPATSISSVGGMCACACSRCVRPCARRWHGETARRLPGTETGSPASCRTDRPIAN